MYNKFDTSIFIIFLYNRNSTIVIFRKPEKQVESPSFYQSVILIPLFFKLFLKRTTLITNEKDWLIHDLE